jgi:anti-anti-sigma regulatory factor
LAVEQLVDAFEKGGCLVLRVLVTKLLHPITVEATVRQLGHALQASPADAVVLDLQNVAHLGDQGVEGVREFLLLVRKLSGELVLCNVSEWVQEVLEYRTILGGSFPVTQAYASLNEAVESFFSPAVVAPTRSSH